MTARFPLVQARNAMARTRLISKHPRISLTESPGERLPGWRGFASASFPKRQQQRQQQLLATLQERASVLKQECFYTLEERDIEDMCRVFPDLLEVRPSKLRARRKRLQELLECFPIPGADPIDLILFQHPHLLRLSPTAIDRQLVLLQNLVPHLKDVKSLLILHPTLLALDLETSAPNKMLELSVIIRGQRVNPALMIAKAPALLSRNIKKTIAERVREVAQLTGATSRELVDILEKHPQVLLVRKAKLTFKLRQAGLEVKGGEEEMDEREGGPDDDREWLSDALEKHLAGNKGVNDSQDGFTAAATRTTQGKKEEDADSGEGEEEFEGEEEEFEGEGEEFEGEGEEFEGEGEEFEGEEEKEEDWDEEEDEMTSHSMEDGDNDEENMKDEDNFKKKNVEEEGRGWGREASREDAEVQEWFEDGRARGGGRGESMGNDQYEDGSVTRAGSASRSRAAQWARILQEENERNKAASSPQVYRASPERRNAKMSLAEGDDTDETPPSRSGKNRRERRQQQAREKMEDIGRSFAASRSAQGAYEGKRKQAKDRRSVQLVYAEEFAKERKKKYYGLADCLGTRKQRRGQKMMAEHGRVLPAPSSRLSRQALFKAGVR